MRLGPVPTAAADWYGQVTQPGVLIGDTNPFPDPTGYRVDVIFQLAALRCSQPALCNTLLQHDTITRPADVLGTSYDYQILYESSAYTAYQANPSTFRYVRLPPAVMSAEAGVTRLPSSVPTVPLRLTLPAVDTAVKTPGAWSVLVDSVVTSPASDLRRMLPSAVMLPATSTPQPNS